MKVKFAILVVGLLIGIYIGSYFGTIGIYYTINPPDDIERSCVKVSATSGSYFSSINVPAVDPEGKGVATKLIVQVFPGNGKVLNNIDNILFWVDTQSSIRTARGVAEGVTKIDLSEYDIIYTITANASVIEGPSAGAALTAATIAALEHAELENNVMITGTVNQDGTIGPVGGILSKAMAAKDIGAGIFLVPLGQSQQIVYDRTESCEKIGTTQICTITQTPREIDVEEEVGIEIYEIGNVKEALGYLLPDYVLPEDRKAPAEENKTA